MLFAIFLVSYYTGVTEPMCRYQYVRSQPHANPCGDADVLSAFH